MTEVQVGDRLEALVDKPQCIASARKGDLFEVTATHGSFGGIKALTDPTPRRVSWGYQEGDISPSGNRYWKLHRKPEYLAPGVCLEVRGLTQVRKGVAGEGNAEDYPAAVGDVTSEERGSGARYNAGKPRLDLIPAHVWRAWKDAESGFDSEFAEVQDAAAYYDLLGDLNLWQRDEAPARNMLAHFSTEDMEEAARVFEYGAAKYAAWNWAKGMAWSVPVGCILRHGVALAERDEYVDPESGRRHWGHVACNVIMLVHFEETYPEGDDRPPAQCWGPVDE